MNLSDMRNAKWIDAQTLTAGQPTDVQFAELARDGVTTVINLAPFDTRYSIDDEEGCVRRSGMQYHFLPVDFKQPALEDFDRFADLFRQVAGGRTLVHCAANYRVSVFVSHYKMIHDGWSAAQADEWIAGIWNTAEFPVWQTFIQTLRASLSARGAS
ncbi:protein tyrosine phosphatase family protein [Burkholderia pyrrocinia]|uniref:protein tyrosine phosphatase family protein n=1 Tax=Burkholderia pyrrocinia TaxID=60550 RepID=UPI00215A2889|nr:protein tyrosine phosphatase family protein [Burkholderia pyrrocinia]UVE64516.1 protein tyrosine phosphatase family protein [Burkholderia pyrrocinia]